MIRSLRIAVADDEVDMRDFLERMLPRQGHQVVSVAENGRQLVEQCRQHQPDLVITDNKMPELDGMQAAAEIFRERPVPVVLISAYHDPELTSLPTVDYIMVHLVKPITLADLEPAIIAALHRFAEL
ncbi:MAG: ANTAR domain-containing response regulator [Pirellulales bacterium]